MEYFYNMKQATEWNGMIWMTKDKQLLLFETITHSVH